MGTEGGTSQHQLRTAGAIYEPAGIPNNGLSSRPYLSARHVSTIIHPRLSRICAKTYAVSRKFDLVAELISHSGPLARLIIGIGRRNRHGCCDDHDIDHDTAPAPLRHPAFAVPLQTLLQRPFSTVWGLGSSHISFLGGSSRWFHNGLGW